MSWIFGILAWVITLNIGAWLLSVDLTWQVTVLVVFMGVIDQIINSAVAA